MKPVLLAMIVLLGVLWVRIDGDAFDGTTYTHRGAGFAIDFPEGFAEADVPHATFAVADAAEEKTCVVLVQELPAGKTALDLMEYAERRGRGAGYARLSSNPSRVGEWDAFRSESRMKIGGMRVRNTELHVVRDGQAVSVQCLAPEEEFDAHFLAFARALDSFRWLD